MKFSAFILSWMLSTPTVMGKAAIDIENDSGKKLRQNSQYEVVGDFKIREQLDKNDASCTPNDLEDVPGKMQYLEASADGKHVFGIDENNSVFFRAGYSGTWSSKPVFSGKKFKQISASRDASIIVGTGMKGEFWYCTSMSGDSCENIGSPYKHAVISPDGKRLWGISKNDWVMFKDGKDGSWLRRSGSLKQMSVVEDGGEAWGVDKDDNVFYRAGFLEKWVKVMGSLKHISVSANGEHIWGVNFQDVLFYRNGKPDHFTYLPIERAKMITVSGVGEDVWSTNRNNDVHYRTAFPGKWLYHPVEIEPDKPEVLGFMAVSGDGSMILGVGRNKGIVYTSDGFGKEWTKIPGLMKSVSLNEDGSEMWGINSSNKIFYRGPGDWQWMKLNGDFVNVATSADGKHVYAINTSFGMWYRTGRPGRFRPLGGSAGLSFREVSVSRDGSHVWAIRPNDEVYYRDGFEGSWVKIDGEMKYIAVSPDGGHVWAVDMNDKLQYRAGKDGTWIENTLENGKATTMVAVSDVMDQVWTVTDAGDGYRRDCPVY